MTRRNFIRGLLTAAAGFTILPPATTYSRICRVERPIPKDFERLFFNSLFFNRPIYEITGDRETEARLLREFSLHYKTHYEQQNSKTPQTVLSPYGHSLPLSQAVVESPISA